MNIGEVLSIFNSVQDCDGIIVVALKNNQDNEQVCDSKVYSTSNVPAEQVKEIINQLSKGL